MRYCPDCEIWIDEPDEYCPLCGAALDASGDNQPEKRIYPVFSTPSKRQSKTPFIAKIFGFISMIAILTCVLINVIIEHQLTWSLYVIGGIFVGWVGIALPLMKPMNVNFMLLADLCSVSMLLVLIDWQTGWDRWSVTYVLPGLYIGIAVAVVVLALVFHQYWREYILSVIVVCVLGIVPLLILLTGMATVNGFCIAAVMFALTLLAGVLFFASGKLFSEWKRRMNI